MAYVNTLQQSVSAFHDKSSATISTL